MPECPRCEHPVKRTFPVTVGTADQLRAGGSRTYQLCRPCFDDVGVAIVMGELDPTDPDTFKERWL